MSALKHVPRLALRDFMHEGAISICVVAALAAVLAPLLVLFGLKFGIIDSVLQRLVKDPHSRELILVGGKSFSAEWVAALRQRPDVAFAIPETRRLSASLNRLENQATGAQISAVDIVPSDVNEPLLAADAVPTTDAEVTVSPEAAFKLGVTPGATVRVVVQRLKHGDAETASFDARVRAIAPETALSGASAFVTLGLLLAVEDFRDGFSVERLGWPGVQPPQDYHRSFPRFRLYARSIYDVAPLSNALLHEGVEVRSRADEVELLQILDRNLTRVFWTIAVLGSIGFVAALAASMVAGVERKRRNLCVLRLLGFSARAVVAFPIIQAFIIGAMGWLIAVGAYAAIAYGLNAYFASSLQNNEFVCRLLPQHLAAAAAITVVCALTAASWAGFLASQIQPAEGLRDV